VIWLTNNNQQSQDLVRAGVEEAIYTSLEYYHLSHLSKKMAKAVNLTKKIFPGSELLGGDTVSEVLKIDKSRRERSRSMRKNQAFPTKYLV